MNPEAEREVGRGVTFLGAVGLVGLLLCDVLAAVLRSFGPWECMCLSVLCLLFLVSVVSEVVRKRVDVLGNGVLIAFFVLWGLTQLYLTGRLLGYV